MIMDCRSTTCSELEEFEEVRRMGGGLTGETCHCRNLKFKMIGVIMSWNSAEWLRTLKMDSCSCWWWIRSCWICSRLWEKQVLSEKSGWEGGWRKCGRYSKIHFLVQQKLRKFRRSQKGVFVRRGCGRTRIREGRHFVDELSGYAGKWNAEGGGTKFLGILQSSDSSYTIWRISRPIWLGPNGCPASMFASFSCFRMSRGARWLQLGYS